MKNITKAFKTQKTQTKVAMKDLQARKEIKGGQMFSETSAHESGGRSIGPVPMRTAMHSASFARAGF